MNRYLPLLLALLVSPAVASAETIRVLAYDTPHFFHLQDGKPTGLEYDLLAYHAKAAGKKLEIVWCTSFDDILPRLQRGDGDVAAATLTVTRRRQQSVDFSEAYFPVRILLVEPRGARTRSLSELSGATLATVKGSSFEEVFAGIPDAHLSFVADQREVLRLVSEGKARAGAIDSAAGLLLADFPRVTAGIEISEAQRLAFAVPKGSPLGAELSLTIRQLKESGIYFRVLTQHLGAAAAELVKAGKGF
jgi:ABC-type amino acid transport substrate-binding protein